MKGRTQDRFPLLIKLWPVKYDTIVKTLLYRECNIGLTGDSLATSYLSHQDLPTGH